MKEIDDFSILFEISGIFGAFEDFFKNIFEISGLTCPFDCLYIDRSKKVTNVSILH